MSFVQVERVGSRALVRLCCHLEQRMPLSLLSCVRDVTCFGFGRGGGFPCTRPWHHDGWVDGYSDIWFIWSHIVDKHMARHSHH